MHSQTEQGTKNRFLPELGVWARDFARRHLELKLTKEEFDLLTTQAKLRTQRSDWVMALVGDWFTFTHREKHKLIYYFSVGKFAYGYKAEFMFVNRGFVHQDDYLDRNLLRYLVLNDFLNLPIPLPCLVASVNFLTSDQIQQVLQTPQFEMHQIWYQGQVVHEKGLKAGQLEFLCQDKEAGKLVLGVSIARPDLIDLLLYKAKTQSWFRALLHCCPKQQVCVIEYLE